MTKVTTFNSDNLTAMRADMVKALAEVEAKYGVQIGIGKMSYTENDFNCKLTTIVKSEQTATAAKIDPKWVADFMRNHFIFGFKKEDLGATIKHQGRVLKLVGSRSRANLPLIVQEVGTDKLMTFSVDKFKIAMA